MLDTPYDRLNWRQKWLFRRLYRGCKNDLIQVAKILQHRNVFVCLALPTSSKLINHIRDVQGVSTYGAWLRKTYNTSNVYHLAYEGRRRWVDQMIQALS